MKNGGHRGVTCDFSSLGTDENNVVHQYGHNIIRSLNDDKIIINVEY